MVIFSLTHLVGSLGVQWERAGPCASGTGEEETAPVTHRQNPSEIKQSSNVCSQTHIPLTHTGFNILDAMVSMIGFGFRKWMWMISFYNSNP